jgi:hypothetical protein
MYLFFKAVCCPLQEECLAKCTNAEPETHLFSLSQGYPRALKYAFAEFLRRMDFRKIIDCWFYQKSVLKGLETGF